MPSPDHPPVAYPDRLPFRSYLYVPPADEGALAAAYRSGADAVVLDLEDLTPATDKARAREAVRRHLAETPPLPTLVRVNASADLASLEADLDAAVAPGLTALRLPKSEDPERVREIARLAEARRVARGLLATIGLQVMVETSRGIEALPQLARATHTVWSLGIGEGDLRAELGTSADAGLAFARSSVVIAARSAHLPAPVQVAFPGSGSIEELRRSTELGLALGFGGRNLLDPDHVPVVHSIYPVRATESQVAS